VRRLGRNAAALAVMVGSCSGRFADDIQRIHRKTPAPATVVHEPLGLLPWLEQKGTARQLRFRSSATRPAAVFAKTPPAQWHRPISRRKSLRWTRRASGAWKDIFDGADAHADREVRQ